MGVRCKQSASFCVLVGQWERISTPMIAPYICCFSATRAGHVISAVRRAQQRHQYTIRELFQNLAVGFRKAQRQLNFPFLLLVHL